MKELSIEQKLDAVLKYVIDDPKEDQSIIDFGNKNYTEFVELLDKLKDDKNIKQIVTERPGFNTETLNVPTVQGRYFYKTGGYTEKIKRDKINSIKNLIQNRIILFGAGCAGIYYLLEILRIYIMPIFQHVCACQFIWQK